MTSTSWIILAVAMTGLAVYFFSQYHYYRSQVKQRGSLKSWPVKPISLPELDSIFETNEFGPQLQTQIQFIGRGHLVVPGGTSDTEAWVLAVLAKKARTIFEFGTCTGKTSYLMALNADLNASVVTLTLPPDQVE